MHLVFDIFQGIGVAAAVGVRPFLPTVVTGGLAAANAQLTFHHTDFRFLQSPIFLVAMLAVAVVFTITEWRTAESEGATRNVSLLVAVAAVVLGALLCGGAIARSHHADWIGIVIGVLCAGVGIAATRPLLMRVKRRLDADAGGMLPILTELAAGIAAGLSVVAPPVGVIVVVALLALLIAGRGRGDQKYAGLRILR